jgi:hypothetical protein
MVYHGTSERAWKGLGRWKRKKSDERILYLVRDLGEAGRYAYETAAADELDGYDQKPLVMAIRFEDLSGMELHPDYGWVDVTDDSTWQDSLNAVGSFSVVGDIESLKKRFVRVAKREWVEAEASDDQPS